MSSTGAGALLVGFDDDGRHAGTHLRGPTTAIGIWVSSYSVGAAIGPLLGGVL
jgi:hypothetical protein